MLNKIFIIFKLACLLMAVIIAQAFAVPPDEIATKDSITTQFVDGKRLTDPKEYPYMITGESLVSVIQKMVDFAAPGAAIVFNRGTAQLFIKTTPANHQQIDEILTNLRLNKPKQVVIEARFLEVGDFEGLDLGVELTSFLYSNGIRGRSFSTSGSTMDFAAGSWNTNNMLTAGNELTLLATVVSGEFDVDAAIRALAQKVKVNTLAAPKITCMNNQRSNIRIATSKNYVQKIESDVVSTSSGSTTSVDVTVDTALEGVALDVTPTVNLVDDTVTLELHPSVVSVDLTDTQNIDSGSSVTNSITLPKYVRQTIDTTVTIPDGGTVILGGLIKETQRKDERKVPFLGDIPILGNLFKYNTEFKDKSNLLIFITTHILNERGAFEEDLY